MLGDDISSRPTQLVLARSDDNQLVARARAMTADGTRRLLGITGSPGAGKSTLADEIVSALGDLAVLVPMDGFHLAQQQLDRLGLAATKGAIDTFDVGGFVHLLMRLHAADEDVVYAPLFRRDLEEPIGSAVAVPRTVPLVVVEGNYLLADSAGWERIRPLLAEAWFVEPDDELRIERLISRHMAFGRDRSAAEAWSLGSDQANARIVEATRARADVVVRGQ